MHRRCLEQPGHLQVIAYLQRAATRAPAKRRLVIEHVNIVPVGSTTLFAGCTAQTYRYS